jgi:hypothetical protein
MAHNPQNMQVHPLPGRRLQPGDLQRAGATAGGTFDRRDLENLWRQPQWRGASVERLGEMGIASLTKNALLSQPHTDSRSDSRFDSELRLIGRTDDGFEVWSDGHGTTIRRRKQ